MNDHELVLNGIVHGFPEWELKCLHTQTAGWDGGYCACWFREWWEAEGITLAHIPGRLLSIPVAPVDWTKDTPGYIGRDFGCTYTTAIGEWDDYTRPTCTHPNVRTAALELLRHFELADWLDGDSNTDDLFPDVFQRAGVCAIFERVVSRKYRSDRRQLNALHAWVTAHLEQRRWCWTCCDESGEGTFPFDECFGDENEQVHDDFSPLWVLNADPKDFVRFAAAMLRRHEL